MKKLLSLLFLSFVLAASAAAQVLSPQQISRQVKDHYESSQDATVSVTRGGSATGVMISEDGLILTAAHMFRNYDEKKKNSGVVKVVLRDGSKFKANLLGFNRSSDMALLRLENPDKKKFKYASLREAPVRLGEFVYLFGHPAGLYQDRPAQIRVGRVTTLTHLKGKSGALAYFMADCNIQPGDSGGPMYDIQGRLVGINSSAAGVMSFNRFACVSRFLAERASYEAGKKWGDEKAGPVGGGKLNLKLQPEVLKKLQAVLGKRIKLKHRDTQKFVQKYQKNGELKINQNQLVNLYLIESLALAEGEAFSMGLDDPAIVNQLESGIKVKSRPLQLYDGKQIFAQAYPWNPRIVIAKASELKDKKKIYLVMGKKGLPLERVCEDKEHDIILLAVQGRGEIKGFKLPALAKKPVQAADLLYAYDSAGLLLWGLACDSVRSVEKARTIGPLNDKSLISKRRDKFSAVVAHHLPLYAKDAVTPVFTESGQLAGLHIARQNRTLGLLIPALELEIIVDKLIKSSGRDDLEKVLIIEGL